MTNKQAFLVGVHKDTFRTKKKGLIVGVEYVNPENLGYRLCYKVIFTDFLEDWIPVSDVEIGNYKIVD